ncbi:Predicted DNA-binding transcriptional regulator YafY, contains an HTH and WYL domains [Amycolatopsis xylanica]|uniref:Predicted DNA-binding transcriptional regulator YafY, contains an HTH and WYL domains n=1 Tax=Amycolatopsis xylanica TaxID=589385 RepID=A0A1H2VCB7_9PSEU|nr:YafY family protein [Amycolatopsis xylanica]SDW65943.1 Predicted DNA-binding transcriptional regulator YafY, contains an HTH and WYL domains [Amycolatopsis xylanica]
MLETSARLLRLLTLLQTRREWPGAELAERLGVSTRTVRRDVDKLRELEYPVHAGTGPGAAYWLGAGAALPPLLLDDDEAVAVAVALRTAAGGGVSGIGETALGALVKLEQVLPSRLRHRISALQIATIASAGPGVDADVLTAVAMACRDRQELRFGYRKHDGAESVRRVEPYRLVSWGRRWYLVAWDAERADWRSFRVDRMSPRIPLGPRFTPREPPSDPATFVSRGVAEAWQARVRVRLFAPAEVVRERMWGLHGTLEPVDGHSCLLHLGAESPRMLAFLLAVLDADFVVESPAGLGDHLTLVAERYRRAAESSA